MAYEVESGLVCGKLWVEVRRSMATKSFIFAVGMCSCSIAGYGFCTLGTCWDQVGRFVVVRRWLVSCHTDLYQRQVFY